MSAESVEFTARVTAHRLAAYRAERGRGTTPPEVAREHLNAAARYLADQVLEDGQSRAWAVENYRIAKAMDEKIAARSGIGSGKRWADKTRSERLWSLGLREATS